MDVKTNTGLVVSVEAVKKPDNSNKVQELAAMEEALKKATEEAHKQRIALTGETDNTTPGSLTQSNMGAATDASSYENNALKELQQK